jgi:hypothetical protein
MIKQAKLEVSGKNFQILGKLAHDVRSFQDSNSEKINDHPELFDCLENETKLWTLKILGSEFRGSERETKEDTFEVSTSESPGKSGEINCGTNTLKGSRSRSQELQPPKFIS